ncbi:K+-transporting ATPase, KdpF subunit [Methylophilaceae bacterium 11]|nr:K+-transporting ATPase, KdpF subunit [Methylophilaceae bacterium 11]
MNVMLWVSGALALLVLIYLLYVLFNPENF